MAKSDYIAAVLRDQETALRETFTRQSAPLQQLAVLVAGVFQHNGRLLLCGSGALAPIADLGAHNFLHRLALERPSLPAVALGHDPHLALALARDGQGRQYFAHQLRALATEGDVLLVLGDGQPDPAISDVLNAAAQLGCLTAVVLPAKVEWTGPVPDQLFRLESDAPPRITELALTFVNLLCSLVEAELFGI